MDVEIMIEGFLVRHGFLGTPAGDRMKKDLLELIAAVEDKSVAAALARYEG